MYTADFCCAVFCVIGKYLVWVFTSKSVCICVADCFVMLLCDEKQTAFACVSLVAHTICFALDVFDVALWKKAEHNEVVRGALG
jgi:hypothetical protein